MRQALALLALVPTLAAKSASVIEHKLLTAGRIGNWQKALTLLDQLKVASGERAASTKAHNNAAAACSRAGQWATAISLLGELRERGGSWDAHSYTTAVTAHGKRGAWQESLAILDEMRSASSDNVVLPPPNEFVFGAAIGACATAGQWAEAMRLLDEMEASGLPPTTRCCNGALSACAKAKEPDAALALLQRMRFRRKRSKPTVVSYSTVLSALGRRPTIANCDITAELLRCMKEDGIEPNSWCLSTAAMAYGATGAWQHALQLVQDMERQRVPISDIVLCNVLNACAVGGAWRPALSLVKGMQQRYGVPPDAACVNAAIKACARANPPQPMLALELLAGLGLPGPGSPTGATERSFSTTLAVRTHADSNTTRLNPWTRAHTWRSTHALLLAPCGRCSD